MQHVLYLYTTEIEIMLNVVDALREISGENRKRKEKAYIEK